MGMLGILQYMQIMRILNATNIWVAAVGNTFDIITMIEQLKKL